MEYLKFSLLLIILGFFLVTGCASEEVNEENNNGSSNEKEIVLTPIKDVTLAKVSNSLSNGELEDAFIIENDYEGDLQFIEFILESRVEIDEEVDTSDAIYIDFVYGENEGRLVVNQVNQFKLFYNLEEESNTYTFDLDEHIYSHFYHRLEVGY